MAIPTLATVGSSEFSVGYPGQLAMLPAGQPQIETRVNESATALAPGCAVARGVAVAPGTIGNCKPIASGAVVIGLAVRSLADANTTVSAGTIEYARYSAVPILKDGYMWAVAAEAITEGDTGIAVVATPTTIGGSTGGAADGTTRLTIPNSVWQQTVSSGAVGLIKIKAI